jgi:hypothetical protein
MPKVAVNSQNNFARIAVTPIFLPKGATTHRAATAWFSTSDANPPLCEKGQLGLLTAI